MDRIGIRELRQNASKYIARVKKGESLEVTERGNPVAVLSPTPKPPAENGGKTVTEILMEMREEERY